MAILFSQRKRKRINPPISTAARVPVKPDPPVSEPGFIYFFSNPFYINPIKFLPCYSTCTHGIICFLIFFLSKSWLYYIAQKKRRNLGPQTSQLLVYQSSQIHLFYFSESFWITETLISPRLIHGYNQSEA